MRGTLAPLPYLSTINSTQMKIANYLLATLFAFFAWVQRNDIDPSIYSDPFMDNPALDSALWLIFYLIIAVGFVVVSFRKLPKWYFAIAIVACFFEMAMSGPGLWENIFGKKPATMAQNSMSAADPRVELSREFFGALIALAAVFFQLWQSRRLKNA